jgi:GT2 family glycosyltransferase
LREVSWLPSANLVVRREVFERLGGFDEGLVSCEDVDLSLRLRREGKVVDDDAIAARHHREPRTLVEFFRKELWHGRDSYARLGGRGIERGELPSLLVPVWCFACGLVALLGLPWWILGGGAWVTLSGLALALLPAGLYTVRALLSKGSLGSWPAFFLLYSIYFQARTLALLLAVHRRTT